MRRTRGAQGEKASVGRGTGRWLAVALLLLGASASPAHEAGIGSGEVHPFVVTGVVPGRENARVLEAFAAYLAERSGHPLRLRFVAAYEDLSEVLRRDPQAVGWTCGAPFVEDRARDGQQLVAVPLFHDRPEYHSLVIAAADREAQSLLDFHGGILAYSDPRSNSGYLAPSWYLLRNHHRLHDSFRLLLHTGDHERSIRAVIGGLADVAAVDEYVWEVYRRRWPEEAARVRVVQALGPFPFTPVVAGREVDGTTLRRLTRTLTGMGETPAGRRLLEQLYLDGFVERRPDFYRPLARMLEELRQAQGE